MASKPVGVFKGCAIGCGAVTLILLIGLIAITVRTWMPLRSSGESAARLEERFGPPGAYAPPRDGAIPAERLERFLEVRRALAPRCAEFVAVQEQLMRVAKLDEEEALSAGDVARAFKGLFNVSTDVAPMIGDYFEERNRALLEAQMGLGEYIYIYALAYREQFLDEAIHGELFSEDGPVSPEVGVILRAMLTRQRAAQRAEGPDDERLALLDQEIEALRRDPQRLPWQGTLPSAVAESLAPFEARLDDAFCRSSAGIAMDPDSGRALVIALE